MIYQLKNINNFNFKQYLYEQGLRRNSVQTSENEEEKEDTENQTDTSG